MELRVAYRYYDKGRNEQGRILGPMASERLLYCDGAKVGDEVSFTHEFLDWLGYENVRLGDVICIMFTNVGIELEVIGYKVGRNAVVLRTQGVTPLPPSSVEAR